MGDPPSDPEPPYPPSSRRRSSPASERRRSQPQPQPRVPEEVAPAADAQSLRSSRGTPLSQTSLWGVPRPQDYTTLPAAAPQQGGVEYPDLHAAFRSEFPQRAYLDQVGLQATHDAGFLLQQDQGDLFPPLESAYPEPQHDYLDQFSMYPQEDLHFLQDAQHGPYVRDDPATQFSLSELAFMPFGPEVQEPEPRELAVQNAKAYLLQTSVSCNLSL